MRKTKQPAPPPPKTYHYMLCAGGKYTKFFIKDKAEAALLAARKTDPKAHVIIFEDTKHGAYEVGRMGE